MKRILNIIGIFFLSIIVFTSCQKSPEELNEGSPQTRAAGVTGTYYWYNGEKIYLTPKNDKQFILFKTSDANSLSSLFTASAPGTSKAETSMQKVVLSSHLEPIDENNSLPAEDYSWATISTNDLNAAKSSAIIYSAPYFTLPDGKEAGLSHLFYVKVKSIKDLRTLQQFAEENKVTILGRNGYMRDWYTLSCTNESAGNALDMANIFYETGLFEACQPDLMCDDDLYAVVNDPLYSSQWHLKNTATAGVDINFENARAESLGSENIIVAVVDHGIQLDHPDLNVHTISYDSETGTRPRKVYGTHGTNCSGFISAKTNNGIGIASIAPNCKLMSISNTLMGNPDSRQKRADAINFACNNGAAVISNSWGSSVKYQVIDDAISNALRNGRSGKGCVVVFASGNDYQSTVGYPANCNPEVIAVGAISSSGMRASFSNYGSALDVVAPGEDVITTTTNSGYSSAISGTSFACPLVAGVAALVLSVNPDLTQKQVADIIESTAKKCGNYSYTTQSGHTNGTWNNQMGYGLVDAYAAVIKAKNTGSTVYFNDKTVTTDTVISGDEISATNVTVKNNAKLTFTNAKSIIITQPFTVELTSSLELSLQ